MKGCDLMRIYVARDGDSLRMIADKYDIRNRLDPVFDSTAAAEDKYIICCIL